MQPQPLTTSIYQLSTYARIHCILIVSHFLLLPFLYLHCDVERLRSANRDGHLSIGVHLPAKVLSVAPC
jgi:hypothetical protein